MRPRERRETSKQDLFRSRLDPGQPPLPTRLMAGLAILKHTYDLSDEALCDRWVENPYFQYFCGEEFFQHALVIRPLIADALAPADGGREASGVTAGEPGSGDPGRKQ
jgi:hypothetical protein